MKKVFVIGGAGSIGSELATQLSVNNEVIAIDQFETGIFELKNITPEIGSIRDYFRLDELFDKYRPDEVYHAAAYKHVSRYEGNHYSEIIETNINGTVNVIKLAKRYKVKKFVFISTDKAVNPKSLMGATKMVGEIVVKRNNYIVVRLVNVLGSGGSVLTIWEKQIARGEPITVTDDKMERYFISVQDACKFVIKVAKLGKGGEIFIPETKPVKIIDLARKYSSNIKLIGAKVGEKIYEDLMTEEEKKVAIKKEGYWVIK